MPNRNDFIAGVNSPVSLENLQNAMISLRLTPDISHLARIERKEFRAFFLLYLLGTCNRNSLENLFLFLVASLNEVGDDGVLGLTELPEFDLKICKHNCPSALSGCREQESCRCLCNPHATNCDLCRFFVNNQCLDDNNKKTCLHNIINGNPDDYTEFNEETGAFYNNESNQEIKTFDPWGIKKTENEPLPVVIKMFCDVSPEFKAFVILYPILRIRFNENITEGDAFHDIFLQTKNVQIKRLFEEGVITSSDETLVCTAFREIATPRFTANGELNSRGGRLIAALISIFEASTPKFVPN